MKFTRLRLSGFKSFVDPTELLIEPGLTGIVGPNGCGKSNLLEALRWVMGETSFKSLRGSAMDDVIFSGSADRPARNTAEVTLTLDNAERRAPAQFNSEDTIEVSRRIEREAGSAYRINAREARARDVQMLFADAATGAHSVALVHQGQIGELIAARPQVRRVILEEAAGISGLHHRRHEAELRLRAAEQNLQRIDDVIGEIDTQLVALQRQARQAARYKSVASRIRSAEALMLHLRWTDASGAAAAAADEHKSAAIHVADLARRAAAASSAENAAAEKIAPLRQDEAEAAAGLQRLRNEDRTLAADAERTGERRRDLERRIEQIAADIERERAIIADHTAQIEALAGEEAAIRAGLEDGESARAAAADRAGAAKRALEAAEAALSERMGALIELRGEHANAAARRDECDARAARLEGEIARIAGEIAAAGQGEAVDLATHEDAIEDARAGLARIEAAMESATAGLERERGEERAARDQVAEAEHRLARLEAEAAALGRVAGARNGPRGTLVESVTVVPGLEMALAAALGDDLDASTLPDAKMRWRELEPIAASEGLPEGAEPLGQFVNGPPALARRLAFTGVVAAGEGELLQRRLTPGQRLVSREGDLWRWDGFVMRAGAETAASKRLAARNRLDALALEIDTAREILDAARASHRATAEAVARAEQGDRDARRAWSEAGQWLNQARAELSAAERKAHARQENLRAFQSRKDAIAADLEQVRAAAERAREVLGRLTPLDELEAEIEPLRAALAAARDDFTKAETHIRALDREAEASRQRLGRIAVELTRWNGRSDNANAHVIALAERRADAAAEAEQLRDVPQDIAARRARLADAVAEADKARSIAADRLAKAETTLGRLRTDARLLQASLTEARETLARADARREAADERLAAAGQAIRDELSCAPGDALEHAGLAPGADLPDLARIEQQLVNARAERERLGAVNLRAEDEASEQQERAAGLRAEREDLDKAIRRLRHAIGTLNSEARGRLVQAFDSVNRHFGELFQTLFAGGTASLAMTDSDDPLEAGLEVVARPPGKRPQTLTLLSGGEQALTAFALILAVFRTNPSPICVLDEVDAPLDDHNVERFCDLVTTLAGDSGTRFLVITHHPYTMARMDRLFGVTMAERGVSRLVSVDLDTAERFREAG